ncbi:unnamed protein product, partial [Symbiodinium microadriaticum]
MTSNALAYHQQLVEDLSSEDVMCRPVYVSWYSQLLKDLYTGRMMSPTDCEHLSPDLPSVHACEFCDQTFDDVRSLRIHQRKSHRDDLPEDWLILPYLWMSDEPGVAPPTRAETSYFLNLFPRPSQMQKEKPEPMDTKDGANSPREPVGPRASASLTPVKTPVGSLPTPTPTTASPASTLTPQQQLQ